MNNQHIVKKHSMSLAFTGFLLGSFAPVGWIVIRTILFYDSGKPFLNQILHDIIATPEHLAIYNYMGLGTAIVLACMGYIIGKNNGVLHERAMELDALHNQVASQKEIFENRYKVLDNNIKNYHQLSSKMHVSHNLDEILRLCAAGLHEVLGYERVNILMVHNSTQLRFVTTAGTNNYEVSGEVLPLDGRIGVIYKCIAEKKVYLIDDISNYPVDFHLHPPYNNLKPLRSKSFVLCPIVVKGEAVGVFGIDNKSSRRPLNDSDIDTIMLFADQVASAITTINLITSVNTLTTEMENSFAFLLSSRGLHFNNVKELKESVDSVSGGSAAIATAAEGVMASVDETSAAVNEISVSIEQVTRNLDHLTNIVHQSASAMEQISSTISNVEQNAAISHEVSSQVKSHADESRAIVAETIDSLAEIQASVGLSYDAMTRLSENSNRIENIVNVINDITKRTNLLALNASIIAAQAGEYGKSFGVVAEEIRNLSLQTAHSTSEITSIIEQIISESKIAANNITLTKGIVQRGVELGNLTGETLKAIYDRSACSMDMTQQIKLATEEQATSVHLVARSMEDISSMTNQIFVASSDQTKATRSIARSVESIKEMTHAMVCSTSQQVEDGLRISTIVDSVGGMVKEMFNNMEARRDQGSEVVKELETMRRLENSTFS